MGSQVPKVFLDLGGVPVITRTVTAFAEVAEVVQRVIVLSAHTCEQLPGEIEQGFAALPDVRIAEGGARRQDSVRNGLAAIDTNVDVVLVHDAARPFVRADVIRDVIHAAAESGAAIAAIPASDTLKQVNDEHVVTATLPRAGVWYTQTPQGFRADLLREAHARAEAEGIDATDDAMLVEQCGHPVRVVPSDSSNFKITTPADLALARALVQAEQAGTETGEADER
jgi:2-C-methyl-D-erythritol 4-phosphate cytidylyltransferase